MVLDQNGCFFYLDMPCTKWVQCWVYHMEWVYRLYLFCFMNLSNWCGMQVLRTQFSSGIFHKYIISILYSKIYFLEYIFYHFFFRIGTCGGVGLTGGTVVITEEAVDGRLLPVHENVWCLLNYINIKTYYTFFLEKFSLKEAL